MRVAHFYAENFKRLSVVEIIPEGDVITIAGRNGQGKSSILDAIWVALAGRGVAPPKPVRTGEEECLIRLDIGEYVITRKFTDKDGRLTDSVKVESADGTRRYNRPQEVLDDLMGAIGFDPFAFVQLKPDKQAEMMMALVPLPIDLDEYAEADASDFAIRRDINREVASLEAQIAAIQIVKDLPAEAPNRSDLADSLASAAGHNETISRLEGDRHREDGQLVALDSEIADLERRLEEKTEQRASLDKQIKARKPLEDRIDTEAIREQLRTADEVMAQIEGQQRRAALGREHAAKKAKSEALTTAMEGRDRERREALAAAKMPIDGLAFGLDEKGRAVVLFGGVPFEQASSAEQLRAATAIAMAGNPTLRVLRIKDGALLDEESMAMLAAMAKEEDFQLWVEVVKPEEGVGFIIENGAIIQSAGEVGPGDQKETPSLAAKKKAAKKTAATADTPDGALL